MASRRRQKAEPGESDLALLNALRHPLRREILKTMGSSAKPISPREISDALDQPLSTVSYHVRVMAHAGVVTLVDTQPVRGSTQHFYKSNVDEEWALAIIGLGIGRE